MELVEEEELEEKKELEKEVREEEEMEKEVREEEELEEVRGGVGRGELQEPFL